MNRRHFLQGLGALVAGIAVEKAVPLGRVWSFPKTIKPLNVLEWSGVRIIRTHLAPDCLSDNTTGSVTDSSKAFHHQLQQSFMEQFGKQAALIEAIRECRKDLRAIAYVEPTEFRDVIVHSCMLEHL